MTTAIKKTLEKFAGLRADGFPYAYIDKHDVTVYALITGKGRVHHLVNDLKKTEQTLERMRAQLPKALIAIRDQMELTTFSVTDIFVANSKERDVSIISFRIKASGGEWSEADQQVIASIFSNIRVRDFKPPPYRPL